MEFEQAVNHYIEYRDGELYYKVDYLVNESINGQVRYKGDLAGHLNREGYRVLSLVGMPKMGHHVVWFLYYGVWPNKGEQIDHINGIKDDNRLDNLRLVTDTENKKNRKLNINNKSGHAGVIWYKPTKKWVSKICVKGRNMHLGCFDNKDEAIEARREAEIKYGHKKFNRKYL